MIGSILVFLLVLSILVLVHELGHFIVARKSGVRVEEFGFGLPPRLIGKKIGETLYSINLLPFGGFVKLYGEDYDEEASKSSRSFLTKSKKTRFLIIIAGVIMNFILAIVAFATVYSFSGIPRETKNVKVVEVSQSSPAQVAGIIPGDIIRKVGKTEVTSNNELSSLIDQTKGKYTNLKIERVVDNNNTSKVITLIPRESPPDGEGPLGVTITTTEIYYPPIWQRPFYGVYYGFKDAIFWGKNIILGLTKTIIGLFSGHVPADISGPIGIYAITSEAAKVGILAIINFIGILSVNLAILNVLPFPALDGGRLLFIVIEKVIGRKMIPKVEATINMIGFAILIALILLITARDIVRLVSAGSISGFIQSVVK